jgi:hypothetical protein
MFGRPVRLLAAAAIAATASILSISSASAACYSCGCGAVTVAPPVVYGYSYAAPVAPCASYTYAPAPQMYVVNQGPSFTAPVPLAAEPTHRRAFPYYAGGSVRWHRGNWGYRHHGYRHQGYRNYGYRNDGYHHHGHRYRTGAIAPRSFAAPVTRYRAVVPGPRHPMARPVGSHRPHAGGMKPGDVTPMGPRTP